jgi:hypothetical protein
MTTERGRYDLLFASGVLYHMVSPVEFLRLVADKTDRLFLWTHYVPDDGCPENAPWAAFMIGVEETQVDGRRIPLYRRKYAVREGDPSFCGGIHETPAWLRRSDILDLIGTFGFSDLRIAFEEPEHPNGPCFTIAAIR